MNKTIEPGEFYSLAIDKLPLKDIDHHATDLYIRVTPESVKLIDKLSTKVFLSTFRDAIEGDLWFELPFCYIPGYPKI